MNWKENIDPLECERNLKSPQELEKKKIVEDVGVQEDLIIKKLKGHSTKKKIKRLLKDKVMKLQA